MWLVVEFIPSKEHLTINDAEKGIWGSIIRSGIFQSIGCFKIISEAYHSIVTNQTPTAGIKWGEIKTINSGC